MQHAKPSTFLAAMQLPQLLRKVLCFWRGEKTEKEMEEGPQTNWRNVRAISLFTFVDSLQFSFYMWSFWPYLQHLDPTISTTFVGLIMAVSGVGEAVAAPVMGIWANKIGHINQPVYLSIVMSFFGNLIYFFLSVFPLKAIPYLLLVSRFLSGAGSGNRGCFRALVAANSVGKDRAKALASSGGAALVGLTIGPSVQIVINLIGTGGWHLGPIQFSKYTVPAFVAVFVNVATGFHMYFKIEDNLTPDNSPKKKPLKISKSISQTKIESPEDADQADTDSSASSAPAPNPISPVILRMDVLAVIICMGTRVIRMLVTSNIESIGSPFTEILFGYSHDEALQWNSYAQTGVGILTIATFLIYAFTDYTKWVSERVNCFAAIAALLIFYLISMPWPFLPGNVNCTNFIGNGTQNWKWCESLAPLSPWMYYICYAVFYGIALSVLNNSLQALYSRVLGSAPQGTMQGVNQAVGCIARILGPLIMSATFSAWGPRSTWAIVIALLALTIIIWVIAFRRLVPLELRKPKQPLQKGNEGCKKNFFLAFLPNHRKDKVGENNDLFTVDKTIEVRAEFEGEGKKSQNAV